ncbi:hypothetical protein MAPG_09270 [Magnaporthiopsis poae ATCC 64411]|uniref:Uncharacterized protein n=1 Tax=Magnaporthiopsis poae (strain ATCC 64411 / 73-15) TaxID=644358 RepID=A0A0C4E9I2_MAGP6|nr:hypothetical protein MAPG_09270 [Magnaporthiopsis poae ATCC 64411]
MRKAGERSLLYGQGAQGESSGLGGSRRDQAWSVGRGSSGLPCLSSGVCCRTGVRPRKVCDDRLGAAGSLGCQNLVHKLERGEERDSSGWEVDENGVLSREEEPLPRAAPSSASQPSIATGAPNNKHPSPPSPILAASSRHASFSTASQLTGSLGPSPARERGFLSYTVCIGFEALPYENWQLCVTDRSPPPGKDKFLLAKGPNGASRESQVPYPTRGGLLKRVVFVPEDALPSHAPYNYCIVTQALFEQHLATYPQPRF